MVKRHTVRELVLWLAVEYNGTVYAASNGRSDNVLAGVVGRPFDESGSFFASRPAAVTLRSIAWQFPTWHARAAARQLLMASPLVKAWGLQAFNNSFM